MSNQIFFGTWYFYYVWISHDIPDSTVPTLPPHGKLGFGYGLLVYFRCKHRQLPDAQCHVNMACNQWLETWDVAIIYTGGGGQGSVSLFNGCQFTAWHFPNKIKSNLNCCCQLTCDDWGIPNTKLKHCQCTSAALRCAKTHSYSTVYDR